MVKYFIGGVVSCLHVTLLLQNVLYVYSDSIFGIFLWIINWFACTGVIILLFQHVASYTYMYKRILIFMHELPHVQCRICIVGLKMIIL